eukprot:1159652-Pelagomonas_calceolata.AAC.16
MCSSEIKHDQIEERPPGKAYHSQSKKSKKNQAENQGRRAWLDWADGELLQAALNAPDANANN